MAEQTIKATDAGAATPFAEASRSPADGFQRLPIDRLRQWSTADFGMFLHFGMSTFDGDEFSRGEQPSSVYAPSRLDASQWAAVARDAGCRYAVLTAKHVAGHALWPTDQCDYHVGTSGNRTDVISTFTEACRRAGVMPGVYYCSWDNHNRLGSATPTFASDGSPGSWDRMFATPAYEAFQMAQLEELATRYGPLFEIWIDIPHMLTPAFRRTMYARLAELQPDAIILLNHGVRSGGKLSLTAWPSDVINYETELPPYEVHPSGTPGHQPWREVESKRYYLPAEVCDTINPHWFWVDGDANRSDGELLGLRLIAKARGTNFLLNVPPDRQGLIPQSSVDALNRLRKNFERATGPA